MSEYLAPGVYMEEIEIGAKPIEGVSTTTTAIIGKCDRGPMYPRLVTSFSEYVRLFGTHAEAGADNLLPYAVQGFFVNGGKRCYVTRVHSTKGDPALLENGITFQAISKGTWGDRIAIERCKSLQDEGEELEGLFKLKIYYFSDDKKNNKAKTLSKGGSENDLDQLKKDVTSKKAQVAAAEKALHEEKSKTSSNTDRIKELENNLNAAKKELEKAETNKKNVGNEGTPGKPSREYNNTFKAIEEYDNLSLDSKSVNYVEKQINGISNFINVTCGSRKIFSPSENGKIYWLKEGSDGAIDLSDYKGQEGGDPKERTGLSGLKDLQEISLICSPDEPGVEGLTEELVDFCEDNQRCFAILQADNAYSVQDQHPKRPSQYSAHYYPWINVLDPVENRPKSIAPCGHVAGIYARTDITRGVHKAPANEVLRDCYGLPFPVSQGEQDILNPRGVNCIRAIEGRGIRLWGARTTSSDANWKYINVRRLFIYLKGSIERGTQWVVFEPNDHRLWARVRQSVSNFLVTAWRNGALMGRKEEEAFFVKCDETTMSQDDIDNGRLIVLIGIAPVKPAEFVVFQIAQVRSGS